MASFNVSSPSTTALFRSLVCQGYRLCNGLHGIAPLSANVSTSNSAFVRLGSRLSFQKKNVSKTRAALVSGEADILSYSSINDLASIGSNLGDKPAGIEVQSDAMAFGSLSADTALVTDSFSADSGGCDLDRPTEGFSSIPEAIEDIRRGKMVVVVDDEDRENEGDLIMPAQLVTSEVMAFIVKHGTGIVCVSMKEEDLERLELPLMANDKENHEKLRTTFTVTVDAKHGTMTGVSARDRATTVLALASRVSKPEDFNRPGHIFPLKYREGGVLKRGGHTEAAVDLSVLAEFEPVGVLCGAVDDDGSMARLPKLREFSKRKNLKIVSIADLIRYRRKRDKLVDCSAATRIPTTWGPFTTYCYRSVLDGIEHIAMVKGEEKGAKKSENEKCVFSNSITHSLLPGRIFCLQHLTQFPPKLPLGFPDVAPHSQFTSFSRQKLLLRGKSKDGVSSITCSAKIDDASSIVREKSVSVILLAGGKGKRMGASMPKQYLPLLGQPIALYSLYTFASMVQVKEIVVVCDPSYQDIFEESKGGMNVELKFTSPGKERQDSVYNGLQVVDLNSELVCIHDSARPLVSSADVEKVLRDGKLIGAAVLGVPVKATIKEANTKSFVVKTLERKTLWEMQTPQVIKPELLKKGFDLVNREGLEVTDDVSIVEHLKHPVYITEGSYTNIKVTTPDDLLLAERILNLNTVQPSK